MPESVRQSGAVAVIGLGRMGSRIAVKLLQVGYRVIVWNRSVEKIAPLVDQGALAAESPADAARRAEVLITMVSDPAALRAVTEGPQGVAAGAHARLTVIEMSTVGPAAIERLAALLPAGTRVLDAPVLGSVDAASSGSLTVLVGGPTPVVERATPLLSTLGSVIHVGVLCAGASAKLVANAAHFDTLGALGEVIALARTLGVSREATYSLLAATPLAAQAERRRHAIETGTYPARFPLSLANKDAGLIHEAGVAAELELPITTAAAKWLAAAQEAGLNEHDYTAVLSTILSVGSGTRRPTQSVPCIKQTNPEPLKYDGLIVDLDGVVWRGADPIDGAADAIAALRANGTQVLFMTNEPGRSRKALAGRLRNMGIQATSADIVTSAAATARVLGSLGDLAVRRAFVIGPIALHEEIREAGFKLLRNEDAELVEVVVVGGYPGFDYHELRIATAAIRNGARLFATGRDAVFPTSRGLWPATGAILAAVETAGGVQAVVVGKPERIMFDIACRALVGCERIGVVGDHLIADIAGANRAGLGTVLVLTGTTTRADLDHATVAPDRVIESLAGLPLAMGIR